MQLYEAAAVASAVKYISACMWRLTASLVLHRKVADVIHTAWVLVKQRSGAGAVQLLFNTDVVPAAVLSADAACKPLQES